MFETFEVQGLYVAIQAVLSLFSNGRTTGMVCDSGDGVTHTVPVFEGFSIPYGIKKNFIAGRVVSNHLVDLLSDDGIYQQGGKSSWKQIIRSLKEQSCFVSLDPESDLEMSKSSSELTKNFKLPDG